MATPLSWPVGALVWPTTIKLEATPTDRQALALSMDWKRELLFGGAAGGGKSFYLLMAALQYVDYPEYRALIVRRTFPQLKIALGLLEIAEEWLSGQAAGVDTVDGLPTRWLFPSGAKLDFGHCQHLKDRYQYQGGGWHFVGTDELTQFLERQYLYICFSRQRKEVSSNIPMRTRATSNPGGVGHEWVRERFKLNADEVGPEDPGAFVSLSRGFIPSKIRDNPYLDAEDYEASLLELHPYERAQLMDGDWDVRAPGSLFQREWYRVFRSMPGKTGKRIRYWDLAATEPKRGRDPDWSVGTLYAAVSECEVDYVVEDVERFQLEPGALETRLVAIARADGKRVPIVIEQEGGSAGKIAARALGRALEGYTIRFERSTGSKKVRAGPFASASQQGRVGVIEGAWLHEWYRELESFSGEAEGHDDQVDSASGAHNEIAVPKGVTWEDLYSS
jgi:predicted phage terminase large subunit-like protein